MITAIRSFGLLAALMLSTLSAHAESNTLMQHLQHMRLASVGVMTDFFMYTGLEGDRKYARRMDSDMESFEVAIEKAREQSEGSAHAAEVEKIRQRWLSFARSLQANRDAVKDLGYADEQSVERLNRLNEDLVNQIGAVYQKIAGNTPADPMIEKTREMALLLQEMTTHYAASSSVTMDEEFLSQYRNSMQELTSAFEFRLNDLKSAANQRSTYVLMDNINNKWRFLRNSITRQHEMDVPFLVISYNDRIIRHLEELEGRIHSS